MGDCKKCPFYETEPVPEDLVEKVNLTEWSSCDVDAVGLAAADRIANQSTHIAALQKEIEKLRGPVLRWIPVEERLPDQCMDVLVCYRDKHILMGTARCDDWIEEDFDDGVITHWMPLPEPPEVENAETK